MAPLRPRSVRRVWISVFCPTIPTANPVAVEGGDLTAASKRPVDETGVHIHFTSDRCRPLAICRQHAPEMHVTQTLRPRSVRSKTTAPPPYGRPPPFQATAVCVNHASRHLHRRAHRHAVQTCTWTSAQKYAWTYLLLYLGPRCCRYQYLGPRCHRWCHKQACAVPRNDGFVDINLKCR